MSKRPNPFEICVANPVALTADMTSGSWIKLIPAGTFQARDGRGPFDAGDQTAMQAIIARTKAYLGGTEMMIDYDHQSVFGAIPGVGGTAKAAGWVKDLEVRVDGIYGRVEWTAAARAAIEATEYRYISPLFTRDKAGKVAALRNAALLNMPAMDLEAIAARAFPKTTKGPDMDEILEALGLSEDAGEGEALASITSLVNGLSAIAVAAGLDKTADATVVAASVADLANAAKASKADPGKPDPAKFVPIEQVTALQADLKSLSDSIQADNAEELVAAAIEAGKLAPALKDWGLELAKADLKQFEAFTANAPALTVAQLGSQKQADAGLAGMSERDPVEVAAAATAHQAQLAASGQIIDIAAAVQAVQEQKS
ncbi:phage protease [Labrenzia sp. CE80]|uniref:phage protease n=1 Tax=Labrenzia sp. CE80 TaxID=1788986 RepID=UPI00129B7E8A|nr:phage protease [Labrenzia sp. CE80]